MKSLLFLKLMSAQLSFHCWQGPELIDQLKLHALELSMKRFVLHRFTGAFQVSLIFVKNQLLRYSLKKSGTSNWCLIVKEVSIDVEGTAR